jgi:signal peptidase I
MLPARFGPMTPQSIKKGLPLFVLAVLSPSLSQVYNAPGTAGIRGYTMTAESMLPTLAPEDRIAADMTYYRSHTVARGDVIVFKFPYQDHPDYIKRVVGVPGDRLKIVNQQVYLNGQKEDEPFAYHDPSASFDPFLFNFPPTRPNELLSTMQPEWAAQIFTYVHGGEIVVPPDKYFVLGDNRNHSWDSRYWGPVAKNDIYGKALYIYSSKDKSRIGRAIH